MERLKAYFRKEGFNTSFTYMIARDEREEILGTTESFVVSFPSDDLSHIADILPEIFRYAYGMETLGSLDITTGNSE